MDIKDIIMQIKELKNKENNIKIQISELGKNLTIKNFLFIEKINYNQYQLQYFEHYNIFSEIISKFNSNPNVIIEVTKLNENYFTNKINEFNGRIKLSSIEFETKEDAEKALDWINSVIIMNKLTYDTKYLEE